MRRGALQIAVFDGGRSPALARQIRKRLEKQFGEEYAGWVARLGKKRSRLLTSERDAGRLKEIAHRMAREITAGQSRRFGAGIQS